ncbi:MAG: MMPL family transporter [Rubrivivax sp.]
MRCCCAAANREGNRDRGGGSSSSSSSGPGLYTALLPLQAAPAANGGTAAGDRGIDAAAVTEALAGLPGTQVLDVKAELDHLYERYLREALWQALLGAAAVVALMALVLRDARRTLAVCQPLALAVLLVLAGLALSGATLGILHLVGLLLVVAVGSNYALFFDQVEHAADAGIDTDTLASLLLANLTTVATFALLAFSRIPALAAIGTVVAPGALLALLLAAVFARPARPGMAAARQPGP